MKWILCLCFSVGLAVGFWSPFFTKKTVAYSAESRAGRSVAETMDQTDGKVPGVRIVGNNVEISREALVDLMATNDPESFVAGLVVFAASTTVLSMDSNSEQGLAALSDWVGLDDEESRRLEGILTNAMAEREAWEEDHVESENIEPGHWTLRFPGDGGKFRESLRTQLETAFPPEKAVAIWLGGNLDQFFGLGKFAPDFRNGTVEFAVKHLSKFESGDPQQDNFRYEIGTMDHRMTISTSGSAMTIGTFVDRLMRRISSPDVVRADVAQKVTRD